MDKEKDRERERRLKDLAEKKQKLAEYRNKSKVPSKSEEPEKKSIEKINNFEDIISVVDKLSRPEKSSSSPVVQTLNLQPNKTETSPLVTTPQSVSKITKKKYLISQKLVEIDIPPKEVEVYNKSTQTTATSTDFPQETQNSSPREIIHSESSLQKKIEEKTSPPQTSVKEDQIQSVSTELSQVEKDKILQSSDFLDFITRSSKIVERALYSTSKFDIAINYSEAEENLNTTSESLKEVSLQIKLFDERWSKHRSVTDVGWSPKFPELILASYSSNDQGSNDPDGLVLVWSVYNSLQRPEFRFNCQSPVTTAFFDKFSPTIIVGGTYSGQIVLWDTRARFTPVQHTSLSSTGHTQPVYCVDVVGTKNAHNLVSISTDGRLCSWSLDNLVQPLEVLELHNKQNKPVSSPIAVTALAFPEGEVNGFFVGSEEGAIYESYRHGAKGGVYSRYEGHHGPVTGIDFHPASGQINFSDLFISCSTDWTCKLWNQKGGNKPFYSFEDAGDYIYDVRWCPSHPSVFATVDGTGSLDLWNLNEETDIPILKTAVSQKALNRLRWSADGKKIVTGDSLGFLYVYDIGEISVPQTDEWTTFEETIQLMVTQIEDTTNNEH